MIGERLCVKFVAESLPDCGKAVAKVGLFGTASAFEKITATVEPEHFRPPDAPLICQLATARCLLAQADAALARDGAVVDGNHSPWLAVRQKELANTITLSTRLRLTPQSRYDARQASRNAAVCTGPRPWELKRGEK